MENRSDEQEEKKSDIVRTDRDNQQESFIHDKGTEERQQEPAEDTENESDGLADKRSTRISDTPDNDNDDTDEVNADGDEDQDSPESEAQKPTHNHL